LDIYQGREEGIQRANRQRVGPVVTKKKPAATKKKAAATKKKAVRRASGKSAARSEPDGPSVEPDLSRPIRPYQKSETYLVGDRIDHQSFGTGVIERVMSRSKVQVYFPEGQKMLLQGRGSSIAGSQRPPFVARR
jgi:hypothetical protein